MKNLLIIPVLWYAARRTPPTGVLTGIFLFLYAFLRIFVDIFREYPTSLLGLATGQALNMLMSILGLVLIVFPLWSRRSRAPDSVTVTAGGGQTRESAGIAWRRMLFALLLMFSMVIPSDWTQDVSERYGKRHAVLPIQPFTLGSIPPRRTRSRKFIRWIRQTSPCSRRTNCAADGCR